jgi:hypothetical protein
MGATPEVRKRLLGLAVAVLALAVLPECGQAQNTASGSVQLVIRTDALPPAAVEPDLEAILWMAPESAAETERLAGLWASGDDARALAAWRSVLAAEVDAQRLESEDQAVAAADWIASRTLWILSRNFGFGDDAARQQRAEEIQKAARSEAVGTLK